MRKEKMRRKESTGDERRKDEMVEGNPLHDGQRLLFRFVLFRFVLCPFCYVSVSFRFVSISSSSFEFTSTVIACAASVAAAAASSMAFLRATASTSR